MLGVVSFEVVLLAGGGGGRPKADSGRLSRVVQINKVKLYF